jgi:hypothetical protein
MVDGPHDSPPNVETELVAGVSVPTTCRDRVDETALQSVASVLEEYQVDRYGVSPVGGLKIWVGVHRPDSVYESLRTALAEAGYGVTAHGVKDGFRRLRVDLVGSDATSE